MAQRCGVGGAKKFEALGGSAEALKKSLHYIREKGFLSAGHGGGSAEVFGSVPRYRVRA